MLASSGALVAWAVLFYWANPWGSYQTFLAASGLLVASAVASLISVASSN